MDEKKENRNLAILLKNLQGYRTDDWITIAKACKELKEFYGSDYKIAQKVGKTREHIREILKLLDLTPELQESVRNDKLVKEVAWRIAGIKEKSKQKIIAKAVDGLNAHDARELVYYYVRNPEGSLDDYKGKILNTKNRIEDMQVIILPINKETLIRLKSVAKTKDTTVQKLILTLVNRFLTGEKQ